MKIQWGKVKQFPFIDNPPSNGRGLIAGVIYDYDGKGFALYHPVGNSLVKLFASPIKSYYFSKHLVSPEFDIYFPLMDRIFLHYNYPEVVNATEVILWSFNNLIAVFENYFIFQKLFLEGYGSHIVELVENEFSKFFVNLRSIYDHVQILVNRIFQVKGSQNFKSSFYKVAKMSTNDLSNKYNYPVELISFHKDVLDHLVVIRKIRDDFVHGGISQKYIYAFHEGFGVSLDRNPIDKLNIHPESKLKSNRIASLLPIFSYFVMNLQNYLARLAELLPLILDPEPPMSNEYHYYVRLPFNFHVKRLLEYYNIHWYHSPRLANVYEPKPDDMTSKI